MLTIQYYNTKIQNAINHQHRHSVLMFETDNTEPNWNQFVHVVLLQVMQTAITNGCHCFFFAFKSTANPHRFSNAISGSYSKKPPNAVSKMECWLFVLFLVWSRHYFVWMSHCFLRHFKTGSFLRCDTFSI